MARAARQLELRGVFAAAVTPHRADSQDPDYAASLELLDFLADGGVNGVCLLGSTGEFLNYGFSERQRLVYLGSKRSRVPLMAGVGHSTFAGAVQLAEEAITAGADCLLLLPPYYYRYSQNEIAEFYLRFTQETRDAVPVLLYNIPQYASKLEMETVRKLIGTGRFAGIKDSSGDWEYFEQLLAFRRSHPFALFSGSERHAARALREGADGLISGSASAVPELVAGLARAMAAGNETLVHALDAQLSEFLDWIEQFPFPAGIKRAVELRGQKAGAPLTPLAPETQQKLSEFASWFTGWLPAMRKVSTHA